MVCRLILFLTLLSSVASAGPWDSLLGSAEPGYVKAVAPRFAKWSFQNFEIAPSSQRTPLKSLFENESAQLSDWTFNPLANFSWPRVQLGLRFYQGKEIDAFVSIFPQDPAKSFADLQKVVKVPVSLKSDYIGFGFSLRKDEYYVFNADPSKKRIVQNIFLNGQKKRTLFLMEIPKPADGAVSFSPLVSTWRGWHDEDGKFLRYELTLDKFNMRFLDGAAVAAARKVNSEFLLNNLRINYKAIDDYDVLYP